MWRGSRDAKLENDRVYARFFHAVKEAHAESEVSLVLAARRFTKTNWSAAVCLLERRWSQRWGRQDRVDVSETTRPTLPAIDLKRLSKWELILLKTLMHKARPNDCP